MNQLIIYTDGGSRGNPGAAAIGVVIYNEKENVLKKYSQYLGDNFTNNEAEYQAVIFALKKVKALFGKKKAKALKVEIRSDSELLVKQMEGLYKILEEKIQELFLKAWNLRIDFEEVKFKLVARNNNKEADKLVNEALDNKDRTQTMI